MHSLEDFFNSIAKLPSLPKVVQEALQMLGKDDVDINVLARRLEHDAVISAKILKLANSAYYGVTRSVTNVDDAIAILGLTKLKTLIIASGVTSSVANVSNFDLKKFWSHSLVTASVSREIAKSLARDIELAYIAGLLHSMGQLLMHLAQPKLAAEIALKSDELPPEARQQLERELLGLDHGQLGEELARRWDFPTEISRVLRHYANPLEKNACETAPIVYMASQIATGLERGKDAAVIAAALNAGVVNALEIESAEWIERIESYRDLAKEAEAFI